MQGETISDNKTSRTFAMQTTTGPIDLCSVQPVEPTTTRPLSGLADALASAWIRCLELLTFDVDHQVAVTGEADNPMQEAVPSCPHCAHAMTRVRITALPPTYNCYDCAEGRRDAVFLAALGWQSSMF